MNDEDDLEPLPIPDVRWNIGRHGRAWTGEEMRIRWELLPEKFEVYDGKLFSEESHRLALVAMLLENVGVDAVVRLGDPAVWRAAVRDLG